MKFKTSHKYDDIINHDYQGSNRPDKMSRQMRAAQFSPFAALTGHHDAVEEKARQVESKIILGKDQRRLLDQKIKILESIVDQEPSVDVTYFIKDKKKPGGKYLRQLLKIKKINSIDRTIECQDGKRIQIDAILSLDSNYINRYFE